MPTGRRRKLGRECGGRSALGSAKPPRLRTTNLGKTERRTAGFGGTRLPHPFNPAHPPAEIRGLTMIRPNRRSSPALRKRALDKNGSSTVVPEVPQGASPTSPGRRRRVESPLPWRGQMWGWVWVRDCNRFWAGLAGSRARAGQGATCRRTWESISSLISKHSYAP